MKEILKKFLLLFAYMAVEYGIIMCPVWFTSLIFRFEFSFLYTGFVWLAVQVMHLLSYRRK